MSTGGGQEGPEGGQGQEGTALPPPAVDPAQARETGPKIPDGPAIRKMVSGDPGGLDHGSTTLSGSSPPLTEALGALPRGMLRLGLEPGIFLEAPAVDSAVDSWLFRPPPPVEPPWKDDRPDALANGVTPMGGDKLDRVRALKTSPFRSVDGSAGGSYQPQGPLETRLLGIEAAVEKLRSDLRPDRAELAELTRLRRLEAEVELLDLDRPPGPPSRKHGSDATVARVAEELTRLRALLTPAGSTRLATALGAEPCSSEERAAPPAEPHARAHGHDPAEVELAERLRVAAFDAVMASGVHGVEHVVDQQAGWRAAARLVLADRAALVAGRDAANAEVEAQRNTLAEVLEHRRPHSWPFMLAEIRGIKTARDEAKADRDRLAAELRVAEDRAERCVDAQINAEAARDGARQHRAEAEAQAERLAAELEAIRGSGVIVDARFVPASGLVHHSTTTVSQYACGAVGGCKDWSSEAAKVSCPACARIYEARRDAIEYRNKYQEEARVERERANQALADVWDKKKAAEAERDAARAEVERLKAERPGRRTECEIGTALGLVAEEVPEWDVLVGLVADAAKRRAEVERLKAAMPTPPADLDGYVRTLVSAAEMTLDEGSLRLVTTGTVAVLAARDAWWEERLEDDELRETVAHETGSLMSTVDAIISAAIAAAKASAGTSGQCAQHGKRVAFGSRGEANCEACGRCLHVSKTVDLGTSVETCNDCDWTSGAAPAPAQPAGASALSPHERLRGVATLAAGGDDVVVPRALLLECLAEVGHVAAPSAMGDNVLRYAPPGPVTLTPSQREWLRAFVDRAQRAANERQYVSNALGARTEALSTALGAPPGESWDALLGRVRGMVTKEEPALSPPRDRERLAQVARAAFIDYPADGPMWTDIGPRGRADWARVVDAVLGEPTPAPPPPLPEVPAEMSPEVNRELARLVREGFAGQRCGVLASASSTDHALALVNYRFGDGSIATYLEASEAHEDGERGATIIALSEAVHVLRNLGRDFWRIAMRGSAWRPLDRDGPPVSDETLARWRAYGNEDVCHVVAWLVERVETRP